MRRPTDRGLGLRRAARLLHLLLSLHRGGAGTQPLVFLQGDRLGNYHHASRQFSKVDAEQNIDTEKLQQMADNLSKLAGVAAIYLGRPGVEGSSGYHGYRKT